MSAEPTNAEILDAVSDWLKKHAATLSGTDAYFARVAANALAIVKRETMLGPAAQAEEAASLRRILGPERTTALLCARLRTGAVNERTPGLLPHLKDSARRRIEIDQPSYRSSPTGEIPDGNRHGSVT